MNEKKIYEPSEIRIVPLDRDLLLTASSELGENGWQEFNFDQL